MKKISFLKNKYLITALVFVVYLSFFENINLISLVGLKKKHSELQVNIQKKEKEIEDYRQKSESLTNFEMKEKVAREKYKFCKEDEVVFEFSNR